MDSKILIGQKAIREHLGIGRWKLNQLIKLGAPVARMEDDGAWWSHKDDLDEFLRKLIASQVKRH